MLTSRLTLVPSFYYTSRLFSWVISLDDKNWHVGW